MYTNSCVNNIFYTFLDRELKNIFKNNSNMVNPVEIKSDKIEIPRLKNQMEIKEILYANEDKKEEIKTSNIEVKNEIKEIPYTHDDHKKEEIEMIYKEDKIEVKEIPCTHYDYKNKTSDIFIVNKPKSSFGEAIKSIRTNLQFSNINKDKKVILVTSPQPSDGKSTISSNLAAAYAQDDKKVLIIDCDLRRGRQADIFDINVNKHFGYTNMILNYNGSTDNFNDYIIKTNVDNIYLIPNGPTPPNPIELLDSKRNKELLDKLKDIFDIIILDTPPVLGLSDTLIMTKYSDENLVVVTKGKTKVEYLSEVKKNFLKVNAKITGVIVNKTEQKRSSYYGYYGEH